MVTNVGIITKELKDDDDESFDANAIQNKKVPDGVEVFEINGPFFFGAVSKFRDALNIIENPPKVLIIRMRNVPAIDGTGIHTLEEVYRSTIKHGCQVVLPLRRAERCAHQFPVRQVDIVTAHRILKIFHIV